MSDLNMYTIFDTKAKSYMRPFCSRNHQTAIRETTYVVNDGQHELCIHAEDYGLFHLGTFDEQTGKIDSQPPVHVVNLIELRTIDPRQMVLPTMSEKASKIASE